jgi:hypothetical protein
VQNRSRQPAAIISPALRPFTFTRLLRETLKLMAGGTIEFRHKAIRKSGRPRNRKREWDAKNFGRSKNPKLNRRKNFAKRLN